MLNPIHLPEIHLLEGTNNEGKFAIEPLYPGYGMTLGNSLRRVLLSSLPGAAISAVKIDGVAHEFSTIPGVREDVVELILNLKLIRLRIEGEEDTVTLLLSKSGEGEVKAGDIKTPSNVEILNPDLVLAHLSGAKTKLSLELRAERGRGYIPVEKRDSDKLEVGMIAVDALYTPVNKVRYNVENTRVGQMTDLDRLVIELGTDGTISPEDAIRQASQILMDHLQVLTGEGSVTPKAEAKRGRKQETAESILIEELNLSPRTTNALLNNDLRTVEDIVRLTDSELKSLKGFGNKAYEEVRDKLDELGLKMIEEEVEA
jgi:DNA-directed RNA polymerase subunit alpha